jgi:hypothetical protein
VQFGIHTLQVRKSNLLFQYHLVETDNEVGIQETTMENTKTQAPTDELEIVQMFRIYSRGWINLEGVVVVRRVLE